MPAKIDTSALPIGSILRVGTTYKVPPFQRDYSWTEDEYGSFWDDLLTTIDAKRDDFFLGSMVFNDSQQSITIVIDGQQRLITISLMLCALRDIAKESGDDTRSLSLTNDFLGRIDYDSGESVPRLDLNKTNARFFSDNIINGADAELLISVLRRKDQNKSNKLLASAYLYFKQKINEHIENKKGITPFISDVVRALDNNLSIIQIKVKDDYDAYLLFETLNDRGLDLSVSDLLKNYLFMKADDQLSNIQDNWDEMVTSLGQHEITKFVRHHWLSTDGVVREKDLYREISNKFTAKRSIFNYSNQLRDSSMLYGALTDIDSVWWDTFEPNTKRKVRKLIEQLNLFNVSQCYPLLLATIESNENIFKSILHMSVVFTFRYSIIGSLGTGNLERVFSDSARFVRSNPTSTPNDIFRRLEPYYPSDEEFKEKFSTKELKKSGLIRYILAQINDYLLGSRGLITDRDPSELNLEHILPKNYGNEWIQYFNNDENITNEYVHRIGNMTLLQFRLNKAISNSNFQVKKEEGYIHNPLEITKPILEKSKWGVEEIDERQTWLSEIASNVWKIEI